MKRVIIFYSVALSIMFAFACGSDSQDQTEINNDQTKVEREYNREMEEVKEFVNEAASEGMMEVQMAEVAMNRSEHPEIDQLAESIKLDHRSGVNELKSLSASKGWGIPVAMTDSDQRKVENLQNADAIDFDEKYLDMTINSHKEAIAKFEKCAEKEGQDADVVAWATRTLPILRRHLEKSEQLSATMFDASTAVQ